MMWRQALQTAEARTSPAGSSGGRRRRMSGITSSGRGCGDGAILFPISVTTSGSEERNGLAGEYGEYI